MPFEPLHVNMTLTNAKVRFAATSRAQEPVIIDYTPPVGDGDGYTSLELLLISLASCAATSLLALLRKRGKTITACTVAARGERRDTHPTSLRIIHLDFALTSPDVTEEDLQQALTLSEERLCPVWAMLKPTAEITYAYQITPA